MGKGAFARGSGHGAKSSTPALAAQIAKVEVDPGTGRIKVLKLVASQDVGYAINPMAVEGQIEGGTVQGYCVGDYGRDAVRRERECESGASSITASLLPQTFPRLSP